MGADQEATRDEIEVQQAEEVSEVADTPAELAIFQGGSDRWTHIKAMRVARNYDGD